MSTTSSFERELAVWMADEAALGVPTGAIDQALDVTGRLRPRSRWLSLLRETPMQTRSRALVGSRTSRLVLSASTVLLLAVAAFVVGGGVVSHRPPDASTSSSPGHVASQGTATPAPATPEPTAVPSPDPNCIPLDAKGAYTARVGTLPVSVTVPVDSTGWRAAIDRFFLGRTSCDPETVESPWFEAALVGRVYTDSCHWKSSEVEVPTAFDAAKELAKQKGHETTEPAETHIGPFRATRLDMSLGPVIDLTGCDGGQLMLWPDHPLVPSANQQIYVAEVDGTTLVITVSYDPARVTSSTSLEIDSILASLRVDM